MNLLLKKNAGVLYMESLVLITIPILQFTFWFMCLYTGGIFDKHGAVLRFLPLRWNWQESSETRRDADYSYFQYVTKNEWLSRNMRIYKNPCFKLLFYDRIMNKEYLIFNIFCSKTSKGHRMWNVKQTLKIDPVMLFSLVQCFRKPLWGALKRSYKFFVNPSTRSGVYIPSLCIWAGFREMFPLFLCILWNSVCKIEVFFFSWVFGRTC